MMNRKVQGPTPLPRYDQASMWGQLRDKSLWQPPRRGVASLFWWLTALGIVVLAVLALTNGSPV